MIIAFDGSRAFTAQKTGTENYSFKLLEALSRIDSVNQYKVYLRPGIKITGDWPANFEFLTLNFKLLWTQVGLALQTFLKRADILFVPSHTLPLIRRPGLKTVMTVHDLGSEYLPGLHQLKQRLYLKFITDVQLKTATKLIAVSQATKNDLKRKVGVSEDKIEVIYEGVNFSEKLLKNDDVRDILIKFGIEKDRYFLFVGTIQPRKNLTRLIYAFKGFLNVIGNHQLVLAGSKGWLSDEIFELPKQLGIERSVKFLGRVSDDELGALYQNATALTYPSLFEGFGLPILEAFYHRCPVITSNVSSMPEVAGGAAILVNPEKTEEIIDAMISITIDNNNKQKLVKDGKERLELFSWQKTASETLALFKNI